MAGGRSFLGAIRRAFVKSPCKAVSVLEAKQVIQEPLLEEEEAEVIVGDQNVTFEEVIHTRGERPMVSIEDAAAIKIQTHFRGHLARRAFRALRSLVKLQAVVRGVHERKQARIAVRCMQALVRLQVRARARQLLNGSGDAQVSDVV